MKGSRLYDSSTEQNTQGTLSATGDRNLDEYRILSKSLGVLAFRYNGTVKTTPP